MTEIKNRFALLAVRLLAWRNGLEGFTSLTGMAWGFAALAFPAYWSMPCAGSMHAWLLTPALLGWLLVGTGALGMASLFGQWRVLRMQTSVMAFMVWGLMAVWSYQVPTVPVADDIAVYSAFAMAELMIYVRILVGLDPSREAKSSALFQLDRRREPPTRSDHDAGNN